MASLTPARSHASTMSSASARSVAIRLLAQHVNARLSAGDSDVAMGRGGGADAHEVGPFALEQLPIVVVEAVDAVGLAGLLEALLVDFGEGDELGLRVVLVAVAVLPADASAADDGGPVGGHWWRTFGLERAAFVGFGFGSGLVAAGRVMVVSLVISKLERPWFSDGGWVSASGMVSLESGISRG